MVFLVMERSAENIGEKKKTDRRKALKSEEKEYEKKITIYIFSFK